MPSKQRSQSHRKPGTQGGGNGNAHTANAAVRKHGHPTGAFSTPKNQGPRTAMDILKENVESPVFEGISTLFAFIHCILLAFYVDCRARRTTFDDTHERSCSQSKLEIYKSLTLAFLGLAVLEWGTRLFAFRAAGFKEWIFLLDTVAILVFGTLFFVLTSFGSTDEHAIFWVTSLQVFRLIRVMRNVKLVGRRKCFKVIWLLIRGMRASLRTLVCSALLLAVTIYLFAVIGTGVIGHSNKASWANRDAVLHAERFDSLFTSILTLMRIMFFDDAFDIMLSIGQEAPFAFFYFASFVGLVVFVVSNLIIAVIVDNAMRITASDEDVKAHEKAQSKRQLMERLIDIFQELDKDGSGFITFEEFINSFQVDQMKYLLQSLDFDEKDLIEVFKTLDDDNAGCLNLDEFMVRMGRLTEDPTAKDFLSLQKLSQSCVDLAKIVAADQKVVEPGGRVDWYEASGAKIIKLSQEMSFVHAEVLRMKPLWLDRVANYTHKKR